MIIPTAFKDNIKSFFYDKNIVIYDYQTVKEADGFTRKDLVSRSGVVLGNVRFNNLENLQKEYGLKEAIDVSITTDTDILVGTIIGYEDQYYSIVKSIKNDSHFMLLGRVWKSKSGTMISS